MCTGVSTSPQKHTHTHTPHFLGNWGDFLYWFFVNLAPKVGFFSEPQKYWSFSSLIPSYLLKVTKFVGKIPHLEFLVMTEKNIFAYKLFLSLNISDFNLFFMWKLQPSWKKSPPLSQQPPSKSWGPVKSPHLFVSLANTGSSWKPRTLFSML